MPARRLSEMIIVDDEFVSIGSTNFDFRSFECNFESNLFFFSREFNERMTEIFRNDLRHSTRIEASAWRKRPFGQRFVESLVLENVPDLLAENRKIAISLAESVMSLVDVIAQYFGIPTMELAMAALPEISLQLEADGIREQAAARTSLDLKGAVPVPGSGGQSGLGQGEHKDQREKKREKTANFHIILQKNMVYW